MFQDYTWQLHYHIHYTYNIIPCDYILRRIKNLSASMTGIGVIIKLDYFDLSDNTLFWEITNTNLMGIVAKWFILTDNRVIK